MTANNDTELKPCPFCGGKAYYHYTDAGNDRRYDRVHCKDCDARIGHPYCNKDQARAAWNTRAASGQGNQEAVNNNPVQGAEPQGRTMGANPVTGATDALAEMPNNRQHEIVIWRWFMKYEMAIRAALSTPSTPQISLPQLKAICEGMKQTVVRYQLDGKDDNINKTVGHNAALDQLIEAAEKAVR